MGKPYELINCLTVKHTLKCKLHPDWGTLTSDPEKKGEKHPVNIFPLCCPLSTERKPVVCRATKTSSWGHVGLLPQAARILCGSFLGSVSNQPGSAVSHNHAWDARFHWFPQLTREGIWLSWGASCSLVALVGRGPLLWLCVCSSEAVASQEYSLSRNSDKLSR